MSVKNSTKEYLKRQLKKKIRRKIVSAVGAKFFLPILGTIVVAFFLLMFLIIMLGQNQDVEQHNIEEYSINGGQIQNPLTSYETNEIPEEFESIYKEIGNKYNVDWEVLASIHRVETTFSSNNTTSEAGAIGHTQFMKCTWIGWSYPGCNGTLGNADVSEEDYTDPDKIEQYGGQGVDGNDNGVADPMELSDSLSATAQKLYDDSINDDMESAIFNYNRDNSYVSDVMEHYNAYKDNPTFVTAGIDDVSQLGQQGSGEGLVVGDMALPLDPDFFVNSMNGGIGSYDGHPGYDFTVPMGTPVYSLVEGTVVETDTGNPDYPPGRSLAQVLSSSDLGNFVRIRPSESSDLMVNYMHLTENDGVLVEEGDTVEKGDQIGRVGNSGKSTAPHLHLDVLENNVYEIGSAIHWYDDLLREFRASDKSDN